MGWCSSSSSPPVITTCWGLNMSGTQVKIYTAIFTMIIALAWLFIAYEESSHLDEVLKQTIKIAKIPLIPLALTLICIWLEVRPGPVITTTIILLSFSAIWLGLQIFYDSGYFWYTGLLSLPATYLAALINLIIIMRQRPTTSAGQSVGNK